MFEYCAVTSSNYVMMDFEADDNLMQVPGDWIIHTELNGGNILYV